MDAITITHTAEEGTLATGDTRPFAATLKACGWKWGRSIGCWYIPNSRDHHPRELHISRTVEALEKTGATVVLDITRETISTAERETNRAERVDDRQGALADKSARLSSQASGRFDTANQIASMIPFGQPILIGHHSEGRARRDAERIRSNMDKGVELHDAASVAARKAAASERNSIHRLTAPATIRRIERLQAELRRMIRTRNDATQEQLERPWGRDLLHRIEEHEDDIVYWTNHLATLEAEGVKVWRPSDIKPGDHVLYWAGKWAKVVRVNPKTVSVETAYSWTDKVPYDQIRGHKTA